MQLRPMTMADADKMLEWKNYPETRQFAILSHEEIKREDHLKWLEKNIIWFQVIENQGKSIGAVRLFGGEVSIWIDREYWGLGIATKVLNWISVTGLYARIVNGNVKSFRAFVKAGFVPYDYKDSHYLLMKQ